MEGFGADMLYTEVDKLRDQLEMGYRNLKWVIPGDSSTVIDSIARTRA